MIGGGKPKGRASVEEAKGRASVEEAEAQVSKEEAKGQAYQAYKTENKEILGLLANCKKKKEAKVHSPPISSINKNVRNQI